MSDQLVRQHVATTLQFEEDYDKRKAALLADYEAKGHRIIDGGQTGHDTWEIIDYRTGETIAAGDGGLEGYAEVAHDHGEMWVHVDPITEHLYEGQDPVTEGLPESLCEALTLWVRDSASDEDIAMVLKER